MSRSKPIDSAGDRLAWPILLLLLTVLVPSAGVVWMMREAVRNERLATGQRLHDAYRAQLKTARQAVVSQWTAQLDGLSEQNAQMQPGQVFFAGVAGGVADSFLIYNAQGELVYPNDRRAGRPSRSDRPQEAPDPSILSPKWNVARALEFEDKRYRQAAAAYAEVARGAEDSVVGARARQAQIRCLLKAGDKSAAIAVLDVQRRLTGVRDEAGRSFAAAAELRLLELLDRDRERWQEAAAALRRRLESYDDESLLSAQRRFLMSQLANISNSSEALPTEAAENLAARVAEVYSRTASDAHLQRTPLPDIWECSSSDGRVIGLYAESSVRRQIQSLGGDLLLPRGVSLVVRPPEEAADDLADVSLGRSWGGWRLGLAATDGDPFVETSSQRRTVHGWIAVLVVAATCVLGWLLATSLRRRMQLAQLKNDLVATVSHELKTPLASIRLLVDTLLAKYEDDGFTKSVETREYLQLIAQENGRLTRLIDSFLTFSRLQRGKQQFDFSRLDACDIVNQAAAVFRERYADAGDILRVDVQPLVFLQGDGDALVTALVNLLENAWKFTEEQKEIEIAAERDGEFVVLSVTDNGVGLTARAASHVFDRFYQVDQRVARSQGGCGLGLSIVQGIVDAHGGTVGVDSKPGLGSKFKLRLPRLADVERPAEAAVEGVEAWEESP